MRRNSIDGEIPTLAAALSETLNAHELKKLAALTGAPIPTRKAELVELIVRHLEGDRLRAVWQSLDETQKAAVAEVVHSGGTYLSAERFAAKYGREPAWGSLDEYGRDARASPLHFFFFGYGYMPADLKKRLKVFVPPPAPLTIKTLAELPVTQKIEGEAVPLTVRESERAAERELSSVLRLVDAGKVIVSDKTRKPSAATITALTAVLEGGDYYPPEEHKDRFYDKNAGPIRAFAWPLLLQAGGLAQLSGTRLALTRAGRRALSEPAAETLWSLWCKWLDTTLLDELSRLDAVKGQTGKGQRNLTAVAKRRHAIAEQLAQCPVMQWMAVDELMRVMQAKGSEFTVTRDAWGLYLGDPQYGSFGHQSGSGYLDDRYLLGLLFEYAATLGLLDVGFIPPAGARTDFGEMWGADDLPYLSRYDGLLYFRINRLGAYCLGMSVDYTPLPVERKPILQVLPNLEIAALAAGLEPGDRLALDVYAVRVSDRVWRLEASQLLTAVEEGRKIDEIREFLSARSAAMLPDTVHRLLADIAERSTRVRDRGLGRLIECADPALAALIANDSRAHKHCLRAGDRHLVVPAAAETAFRRALRELGYLIAGEEVSGPRSRVTHAASRASPPRPAAEG